MSKGCVFIDRDDTIAKNVPYCDSPDKFVLFPGIPEQIKKLNDAGFLVIMITFYESSQRLTVATLSLLTMISSSGAAVMWMRILPRK